MNTISNTQDDKNVNNNFSNKIKIKPPTNLKRFNILLNTNMHSNGNSNINSNLNTENINGYNSYNNLKRINCKNNRYLFYNINNKCYNLENNDKVLNHTENLNKITLYDDLITSPYSYTHKKLNSDLPKGHFDSFFVNNRSTKEKNNSKYLNSYFKIQRNNEISFTLHSEKKRKSFNISQMKKENKVAEFSFEKNKAKNNTRNHKNLFIDLSVSNTVNIEIKRDLFAVKSKGECIFNSGNKRDTKKLRNDCIFLHELSQKSLTLPVFVENSRNKNKKAKKNKTVSFDDEIVTIKYDQKDYIKNLMIFNNKGFVAKHLFFNSKDYINKIKKNNPIKAIILKKDNNKKIALEKLNQLITECDNKSKEKNIVSSNHTMKNLMVKTKIGNYYMSKNEAKLLNKKGNSKGDKNKTIQNNKTISNKNKSNDGNYKSIMYNLNDKIN